MRVASAGQAAYAETLPVIILGIFWKRATREGAIWGMITGLAFTAVMILLIRTPQILQFMELEKPVVESFFGVNAQGIGTVGMLLNFAVMVVVSLLTPPPPPEVQEMVEGIRYPFVMGGEVLEARP